MKGLHNLHKAKGSTRRKKRLGRGSGSGRGNYSGHGLKGQKARSGGRQGLTARSMKSYLLRIPKVRGFRSPHENFFAVNLAQLQKYYNDNEKVTPKNMRSKGLISRTDAKIKILADGSLSKKLTVVAHSFSAQAREAIEKAGGSTLKISATRVTQEKKKDAAVTTKS